MTQSTAVTFNLCSFHASHVGKDSMMPGKETLCVLKDLKGRQQ